MENSSPKRTGGWVETGDETTAIPAKGKEQQLHESIRLFQEGRIDELLETLPGLFQPAEHEWFSIPFARATGFTFQQVEYDFYKGKDKLKKELTAHWEKLSEVTSVYEAEKDRYARQEEPPKEEPSLSFWLGEWARLAEAPYSSNSERRDALRDHVSLLWDQGPRELGKTGIKEAFFDTASDLDLMEFLMWLDIPDIQAGLALDSAPEAERGKWEALKHLAVETFVDREGEKGKGPVELLELREGARRAVSSGTISSLPTYALAVKKKARDRQLSRPPVPRFGVLTAVPRVQYSKRDQDEHWAFNIHFVKDDRLDGVMKKELKAAGIIFIPSPGTYTSSDGPVKSQKPGFSTRLTVGVSKELTGKKPDAERHLERQLQNLFDTEGEYARNTATDIVPADITFDAGHDRPRVLFVERAVEMLQLPIGADIDEVWTSAEAVVQKMFRAPKTTKKHLANLIVLSNLAKVYESPQKFQLPPDDEIRALAEKVGLDFNALIAEEDAHLDSTYQAIKGKLDQAGRVQRPRIPENLELDDTVPSTATLETARQDFRELADPFEWATRLEYFPVQSLGDLPAEVQSDLLKELRKEDYDSDTKRQLTRPQKIEDDVLTEEDYDSRFNGAYWSEQIFIKTAEIDPGTGKKVPVSHHRMHRTILHETMEAGMARMKKRDRKQLDKLVSKYLKKVPREVIEKLVSPELLKRFDEEGDSANGRRMLWYELGAKLAEKANVVMEEDLSPGERGLWGRLLRWVRELFGESFRRGHMDTIDRPLWPMFMRADRSDSLYDEFMKIEGVWHKRMSYDYYSKFRDYAFDPLYPRLPPPQHRKIRTPEGFWITEILDHPPEFMKLFKEKMAAYDPTVWKNMSKKEKDKEYNKILPGFYVGKQYDRMVAESKGRFKGQESPFPDIEGGFSMAHMPPPPTWVPLSEAEYKETEEFFSQVPGKLPEPYDVLLKVRKGNPYGVAANDFVRAVLESFNQDSSGKTIKIDGMSNGTQFSLAPSGNPLFRRIQRALIKNENAYLRTKSGYREAEVGRVIKHFLDMPSSEDFAAMAIAGQAARGWYAKAADDLFAIFGRDTRRFVALLAAFSPQTKVKEDFHNTLAVWGEWIKSGRPTSDAAIRAVIKRGMPKKVSGLKAGELREAMENWTQNAIRALSAKESEQIILSGPKVNSFMLNLLGIMEEVTNDTWMAMLGGVDQKLFKGELNSRGPGKRTGYLAMNARVREAAEILSERTGEEWTPAEVQETMWSWGMMLYDLSEQTETLPSMILSSLTDEMIAGVPNFSDLILDPKFHKILEENGYGEALETLDSIPFDPAAPKADPAVIPDYERRIAAATQRLDRVRQRRHKEKITKRADKKHRERQEKHEAYVERLNAIEKERSGEERTRFSLEDVHEGEAERVAEEEDTYQALLDSLMADAPSPPDFKSIAAEVEKIIELRDVDMKPRVMALAKVLEDNGDEHTLRKLVEELKLQPDPALLPIRDDMETRLVRLKQERGVDPTGDSHTSPIKASPLNIDTFDEFRPPDRKGKPAWTPNEAQAFLQKELGQKITFARTSVNRMRALGWFVNKTLSLVLTSPTDIYVTAHEIGHALDNEYELLGRFWADETSWLDEELLEWAEFGSSPPAKLSDQAKLNYSRGEGFAVFISMLTLDPDSAAKKMPKTLKYYQDQVGAGAQAAIKLFSDEMRMFLGSEYTVQAQGLTAWNDSRDNILDKLRDKIIFAGDLAREAVEEVGGKVTYEKFVLEEGEEGEEGEKVPLPNVKMGAEGPMFYIKNMDRINQQMTNPFRFSYTALRTAAAVRHGMDIEDLPPEVNGYTLARLYLQMAGKVQGFFQDGPTRLGKFESLDTKELVAEYEERIKELEEAKDDPKFPDAQKPPTMQKGTLIKHLKEAIVVMEEGGVLNYDRLISPFAGLTFDQIVQGKKDAVSWMQAHRVISMKDQVKYNKILEAEKAEIEGNIGLLEATLAERNSVLAAIEEGRSPKKADQLKELKAEVKNLKNQKKDLQSFLSNVNARIAEASTLIQKFAKMEKDQTLSPLGIGIEEELDVALGIKKQLEDGDPAYLERVKKAAYLYRAFMQEGLRYMRDGGKISEETFNRLVRNNEQYVEMRRLRMASPTQTLEYSVLGSTKEQLGETAMQWTERGVGKKIGELAQASDPIRNFHGSAMETLDPYQTMYETMDRMLTETDRNIIVRTHVDLIDPRKVPGLTKKKILRSIAAPADPSQPFVIPVWRDGKKEYWQFQRELYINLRGLSEQPHQLPWPITLPAKIVRWSVTSNPVFALRQRHARDPQELAYLTRTEKGAGVATGLNAIFQSFLPVTEEMQAQQRRLGTDQSNFFGASVGNWHSFQVASMQRIASDSNVAILAVKNFPKAYNNWIQKSDQRTRATELARAIKYYIEEKNYDPINAHLQASLEALDLMHFNMAGEFLRMIRQIIPFGAIPAQSARRQAIAWKEDWLRQLYRVTTWGVFPAIVLRYIISELGFDDEYEQQPSYIRDMGWNIPIPTGDGGVTWGWVPRSYEWGLFAAAADRAYSYHNLGKTRAYDGFAGSIFKILSPFDQGNIAGPYTSVVEWITGYDFFRDRYIIPPHELTKPFEERKGMEKASTLAKSLSTGFGIPALVTGANRRPIYDPRLIDQSIHTMFPYWGRQITSASNIGRDDADAWTLTTSGFFRRTPAINARDVQTVFKIGQEDGRIRSLSGYRPFRKALRAAVSTTDEKTRERRYARLITMATRLVDRYEKRYGDKPLPGMPGY